MNSGPSYPQNETPGQSRALKLQGLHGVVTVRVLRSIRDEGHIGIDDLSTSEIATHLA
jgi:hypothetical protein